MATKRQPKPVDTIYWPDLGWVVPMFFDKKNLDFYAEVQDVHLRAKSVEELRKHIHTEIKNRSVFKWERIIAIKIERHVAFSHTKHRVGFDFTPHMISKTPGNRGEYLTHYWVEPEDEPTIERQSVTTYHGPTESHPPTGVLVIPYSKQAMETLAAIGKRIDDAYDQLIAFAKTPDAANRLASGLVSVLALPSPKEGTDE